MNYFLSISFLLNVFVLFAQECDQPYPPSDICATAPVICDLDGYCSSNSDATWEETPQGFCGIVENNEWFAFIAGSKALSLEITISNCNVGRGLQAIIFATDDCEHFTAVSNCLDPIENKAILNADGLIIGKKYIVMIDGKRGDICDYKLKLLSGKTLSSAAVDISIVEAKCGEDVAMLKAEVLATSNTGIKYKWTTKTGKILSSDTGQQVKVQNLHSEDEYKVVVTDISGCTDSATIVVAINEGIKINKADSIYCFAGAGMTLSVEVENGLEYLYHWTTQDGNIVSGSESMQVVIDNYGTYKVVVSDPASGCKDSMYIHVGNWGGEMEVTDTIGADYGCNSGWIKLGVDGAKEPYTFIWNDPALEGEDGDISGLHAGEYSVSIVDANNCGQVFVFEVPLEEEAKLIVPNVFFPSGQDDINKKFTLFVTGGEIDGKNMKIKKIFIFNRWGTKVFEAKENDNPVWDGTYKGKEMPPGVYIYKLEVESPCGGHNSYTGQVLLMR